MQVHDSGRSPDLGNRLSNCKLLMTRPHGNGYRTRSRSGISVESALGTFDVENVLKERMHAPEPENKALIV
jgi:hypothetical protein